MDIPAAETQVKCCSNDHLLCDRCCSRVNSCPLCKENFQVTQLVALMAR